MRISYGFGIAARAVAIAIALGALHLAPGAASAQSDPGSIGVRLLDVPSASSDDPRARQYIVDQLEPGATIERRFEISNTTAEAVTVEVYPSAAKIVDGVFLGDAGKSTNDLTSRTTISEPTLDVPANSVVIDSVSIVIPLDAAPGEQYGAIWVEARGSTDAAIEMVNRVGIRMYVSVGGGNAAAAGFTIDSMTASRDADGTAVVTATVINTGGRALDATAVVTLTKVGGTLVAGPYSSTKALTIAPGDTADLPITITDDVDAGPWAASVEITSGALVVASESTLTFPAAGSGDAVPATSATDDVLVWIIVGLVVLLLILGAVAFALVRRRRARDAASAVAPTESIDQHA